ncbi:MAG: TrkA family potassium uptake protein [Peptococcaceae bacterium]|jgi:trk system potassium uptake protein TrkA|nr:TrkA family potassium uptake protein [Peptococcaceae bacterium]
MKSYIVLGLGRFGISFARTLMSMGHEVLGVDSDEKLVQHYANDLTHAMVADLTNEDYLAAMDITKFDAAIVAVGSILQVSIMATVILKELDAKYILAKAQNDFHAKVLYKVGADKVVLPENDMGIKAAHSLAMDDFFEMIEVSEDYSIINVTAPASWCNKTLSELALRTKSGLNIVAIKRERNGVTLPTAHTVIKKGDNITVIGSNHDLKRIKYTK